MTRFLCWWLGHWHINEEDGLPDVRNGIPLGAVVCTRCGDRQEDWRLWC